MTGLVDTSRAASDPEESSGGKFAMRVVALHLALVMCLGHVYAKTPVPLAGFEVFPTELVLVTATVFGLPAIRRVPWDSITKLVVAFVGLGLAWIALAGLGGSSSAGAKAFSFFVYSAFYFVIRGSFTTHEARWRLLRLIALCAIPGALLGLWQMQTGTFAFGSLEVFEVTTTGSTRFLGGDFALYGTLAAIVIVVELTFIRVFSTTTAFLFAAAAIELVLAQHRSAFVAFAVGLGATFTVLGGSTQALKGILKVACVVTIGLVAAVWLFGGSYLDDTLTRIAHTSDMSDENTSWRLLSWFEVFDGIVEQPLGHGFARWEFLFTWRDPMTGSHNSFLDLAYRIGVPGLLLFLALPFTLVRRTRALVQATSARTHVFLVTVCSCMIAFLVYAAFNVVLETPYMSILFWVLLALGASASESARER